MREIMVDMTEFIPKGHLNGVSREELHIITGMCDRDIRAAIAWTTVEIEPIYSFEGTYFRYKNKSDRVYIDDYIRQEEARLKTQRQKVKALRRG